MIITLTAITKELVLACRQLGLVISDILASYIASTIVNPATKTFYFDTTVGEDEARAIVEESLRRLLVSNDPIAETLRLQATYETQNYNHHRSRDDDKKATERAQEDVLGGIRG